ncbi:peptidase M16 inactive domain protein [Chlamydia ibidis]|uniref:Protease 3 n=2 Tax=Chlamydia ibidis TaxID=1405396 RepID=S7KEA0_9CHLA|nr:insulinase family protein [Chlamydia ibidis]EPP34536.1 peptidase M16 inactive domain protein [Chlamydia ibidis]EQM62309.1 peptidase M16 inactive domain protein [Chlamydia ibidis 10-1398/6]
MRFRFGYILVSLSLIITSCGNSAKKISDLCPLKVLTPAVANQKIAKMVCKNGLQLLIISNPDTAISGAALAVKTGNNADPEDIPGMAHFTEHCVFLGNEKYPEPSGFANFLSSHNGMRNAFTSPRTTSFIFSIDTSAFNEAITQFVHMFIRPLFRQEDLDREKYAVDQEFSIHPNQDTRRIFRIQQIIAPKGNPIQKFGCGNEKTLSKVTSEDMRSWFYKHYSPENMVAIVYTSDPIDLATKNLTKIFGEIPSSDTYCPNQIFLPSGDTDSLGKIYINQANQPQSCLEMYWHLYDSQDSSSLGCYAALSHILTHEGENGLISLLKRKHLITAAYSGYYRTSTSTGDFYLSFELTEQGDKEYSQILTYVFDYLKHMQKQGIPKYCLEEINKINSLNYVYSSNTELFQSLTKQISDLTEESLSTYPYQSLVYPEYTIEEEKHLLSILSNPALTRYILSTRLSSHLDNSIPHYDPIFNMTYYECPLPDLHNTGTDREVISFPEPNTYIPENFSDFVCPTPTIHDSFPFSPQLAYEDDQLLCYVCQDTYYTLPKLSLTLRIRSPQISRKNLASLVSADIYSLAVEEKLREKFFSASLVGITLSASQRGEGFDLTISGYTTITPALLKSILPLLPQIEVSEEQFISYQQQVLQNYTAGKTCCPVRFGLAEIKSQVMLDSYSYDEKIRALQEISFSDFQRFKQHLFEKIKAEALIVGALSEKQENDLISTLKEFISSYPIYQTPPFCYQIRGSSQHVINLNYPLEGNGMILMLGSENNTSCNSLVANEMMFDWLHEIAFHELRTQQQLGYMVGARHCELASCPFGFFYIRSATYSPQELTERTKTFIKKVVDNPEAFGMSPEYFSNLRSAYIQSKLRPSFPIESTKDILFNLAFENSPPRLSLPNENISAARNMTYEEFLEFSKQFLSGSLGSELLVHVVGTDAKNCHSQSVN